MSGLESLAWGAFIAWGLALLGALIAWGYSAVKEAERRRKKGPYRAWWNPPDE